MTAARHWTLGSKLAIVATPFLLLALLSIAFTLWLSWQLEGGAAAINEAGRMRMQAYRMALAVGTGQQVSLPPLAAEFDRSLDLLRHGDSERPLFVPWDDEVSVRFVQVQAHWQEFKQRWVAVAPADRAGLSADTRAFAGDIDALVQGVERHMSRWTALLHLAQLGVMALAIFATAVLVYTGYLFVLEPAGTLKQAIRRIQEGDLSVRVETVNTDEFGTLAEGFNNMAEHVQSMYRHLEARVAEKTAELEEKRERLQALYDVTALVAGATSLQELAQGFVRRLRPVAKADAVALRWSDESNSRFLLLASEGLPAALTEAEHCLNAGECYCGETVAPSQMRIIPIRRVDADTRPLCEGAGYETVVSVPIVLHDRLMGEVDLFHHAQRGVSDAERSLLEALTAHLAAAMENLRLAALEKEAAVSQERSFIARELHDSIAQSLAFLKIQVQLMQDALTAQDPSRARAILAEIDEGVRESYADVRELLVHFRTRASSEDVEPALRTTLRKFEQQTGLPAQLSMEGSGLPLAPDVQVQVLHVVQEALSNVRKHAKASGVWVDVQQQPRWRFEIRDDGAGFLPALREQEGTHVGLRIMQERAERIGAELEVISTPGRGTSVVLTLPAAALPRSAAAPVHA